MKRFVTLILSTCMVVALVSQEITLSVSAPPVVAVGDQFMVTWTVNSRGGEFQPPVFDDFYRLMGPNTSFSSSTQIVNGKVISVIKNSFSYYLQATSEGEFTLGQAKYVEKRVEYLSDLVQIEVVGSGSTRNTPQKSEETSPGSNENRDLYVRLIVNRSEVYMGEHLVATLKLYSKINLSGIQEYKFPDFNSFFKEDIATEPPRNLERENINGEIYGTAVLQRFILFPQRSGTIEINPATLTVLVQEQLKTNDPFFGDFFSSFNTVPKVIVTTPVTIKVKPLPKTSSPSFTGTVGNINIQSSTDKDSLSVNEALTYKITLEGSGNLKLAVAPIINISPDIEIYEPKTSSDLLTSISGTTGNRTYEYLLIPRYHGAYTIPSYKFTYFDPIEDRYKTVETDEIEFFVSKSEQDESAEVYGGISREDVRYLGKDIRYIRVKTPNFRGVREILISNINIYLIFLLITVSFFSIIFLRREQVKRNSDLSRVKNRKAARVASKMLKKAANSINNDNRKQFYAELLAAIWGYLSDKLGIPISQLTRVNAIESLKTKNIDSSTINATIDLLDRCEFSSYSQAGAESSLQEVYNMAVSLIRDIESKI